MEREKRVRLLKEGLSRLSDEMEGMEEELRELGEVDGVERGVQRQIKRWRGDWERDCGGFMRRMGYLGVPMGEIAVILGKGKAEVEMYRDWYEEGGVSFNIIMREGALRDAMSGEKGSGETRRLLLRGRVGGEFSVKGKSGEGDEEKKGKESMSGMIGRARARIEGKVGKKEPMKELPTRKGKF